MLIVIDPHSGVPVYRQLVEQIRFQIASGLLAAGDELPSTRTLSEQLGLNPMTVSKAYSLLEQDGVVRRRAGLPLVVSDLAPQAAKDEKLAQLRQLLGPPALAARQLGIPVTNAVAEFRRLLTEAGSREEQHR